MNWWIHPIFRQSPKQMQQTAGLAARGVFSATSSQSVSASICFNREACFCHLDEMEKDPAISGGIGDCVLLKCVIAQTRKESLPNIQYPPQKLWLSIRSVLFPSWLPNTGNVVFREIRLWIQWFWVWIGVPENAALILYQNLWFTKSEKNQRGQMLHRNLPQISIQKEHVFLV